MRTCSVPATAQKMLTCLFVLSLSACSTSFFDNLGHLLKSSESCYTPLRSRSATKGPTDSRPSKVPLLSETPPGSRILGTFKINADFALALKALEYNARRVGADAAVIQKLTWWDINHWEDPKTVTKTKVDPVSESEKKEYDEKLKEYEAKKREGKPAKKPAKPEDSRSEESVFVPGHWNHSGGAYLEAVMVELQPR